jgi:hypothetical protein
VPGGGRRELALIKSLKKLALIKSLNKVPGGGRRELALIKSLLNKLALIKSLNKVPGGGRRELAANEGEAANNSSRELRDPEGQINICVSPQTLYGSVFVLLY